MLAAGAVGAPRPSLVTVVLGSRASLVADGFRSLPLVPLSPLNFTAGANLAHPLSLRAALTGMLFLFFSSRFDIDARLFADAKARSRSAAFSFF